MLVDKFVEFLREVRCTCYVSRIPTLEGVIEISINGDIPKDKLERFLRQLAKTETLMNKGQNASVPPQI